MAIGTTNFPASLDTATELIRAVNDAKTTIGVGGASSGATTINVASATGAPADGIAVIVSATDDTVREIVSYTGKTSNTLTGCTRNLESSGAKTWAAGDIVYFDTLTALSRTVLVNALLAIEAKLGIGADTPASGEFLKATGAGSSGWSGVAPGDVSDFLRVVSASVSENTATNSSTSTYATHVSTTAVLPAGTWEITVYFIGTYTGNTGATGQAEIRINAPFTSSTKLVTYGAGMRTTGYCEGASASVVSDGVAATTVTGQFRRTSFTSETVRADGGTLIAICRRKS